MKKFVLSIGALILLFAIGRLWYSSSLNAVDAENTDRVLLTIPKGASTNAIADQLEEESLISSPLAFKMYVRSSGNAGKLQAGSFVLTQAMDTPAIVQALMSGKAAEAVITIPEGFTIQDIDDLLVQKGLASPGDVVACANTCAFDDFDFLPSATGLADRGGRIEGYVFPDTYFVTSDSFDVESFLERLLATFRTRVIDTMGAEIAASNRSLHEIVSMASLIEEETRTDDERAIVSGILWKRYDEGMGLGVDAAVRYILQKPTMALTTADLNTNSAYNLRKLRGLPPGPIASPSLASITAALQPESSSYYYYLHGTDGQIRYAETNEEHNINKYKYLR